MLVISGTNLATVVKKIMVNMVNFNINTFPFEGLGKKKKKHCILPVKVSAPFTV